MKCEIELAPNGSLRLTTPSGRTIDLAPVPAAIALLQRTLYHAAQHDTPTAFPTQHVIDAWNRGRAIDWSRPEPTVKRTVVEILPEPKRKSKPSLRAFKSERASRKVEGIDLATLDISL